MGTTFFRQNNGRARWVRETRQRGIFARFLIRSSTGHAIAGCREALGPRACLAPVAPTSACIRRSLARIPAVTARGERAVRAAPTRFSGTPRPAVAGIPYRPADHDIYPFPIAIANLVAHFDAADDREFDRAMTRWRATFDKALRVIAFGGPRFCVSEVRLAFRRIANAPSGQRSRRREDRAPL
ncbi:MAG: hypothetical protein ACOY45_02395 [Pseudomonadota bacterium]